MFGQQGCTEPSNITVNRTSAKSATITANDLTAKYDLYVALKGKKGPDANEEPNYNLNNDITFPVTRNNLTPGFSYDIYVRKQCSATDASAWVGPFTIDTYSAPIACVEPSNVTVKRTSTKSATITADDLTAKYDLYVALKGKKGPDANEEPNYNLNNDITFPVTRNNLTPGFSYDIYVRKQCSATDASAWVGPFTIDTYSAPNVCTEPTGVKVNRTSGTKATITADNLNAKYDVYAVLAGKRGPAMNEGPNHAGNNDVTFPLTRTNLTAGYTYDIYVRMQCDTSTATAWVGPYTINTVSETMSITPNPTRGMIYFKGVNIVSAEIFDMNGNKVLSSQVNNNELDLVNLAAGQYILHGTDINGKVYISKLTRN
ncbi:MAG: T9SS type A sorting domain-containing protein [Weeksellaceae bacterium]